MIDESTLKISEKMLSFEEGKKLSVYKCSEGFLTVGIGHNLQADPARHILFRTLVLKSPITEAECSALFQHDLKKVLADLDTHVPWWHDKSQAVQLFLINATFQLGIGGLLGFKNTLKMIKSGMNSAAAIAVKQSKWYRQTPNRVERNASLLKGSVPKEYLP